MIAMYDDRGTVDFCRKLDAILYSGKTVIIESELRDDGRWFRMRTANEPTPSGGWRIEPYHALLGLLGRMNDPQEPRPKTEAKRCDLCGSRMVWSYIYQVYACTSADCAVTWHGPAECERKSNDETG